MLMAGALLAFSMLLVGGCSKPVNGEENSEENEAAAIPVEAAKVTTRDMAAFYSGTTTLEADKQALVVSQITGVVLQINA